MTTHASFMQAILADRESDGPRLVYADWLDEQGETARAEFIRVQCRADFLQSKAGGSHAHHTDAERNCFLCAEVSTCRRRADELHDEHGWKWLPLLPGKEVFGQQVGRPQGGPMVAEWGWRNYWLPDRDNQGTEISATFRRGFVAEVALSAEAWLGGVCPNAGRDGGTPYHDRYGCTVCNGTGRTPGHADALMAATPLQVVRLTTMPTLEHKFDGDGFAQWRVPGRQRWYSLLDYPVIADTPHIFGRILTALWPTLRFELPPANTYCGPTNDIISGFHVARSRQVSPEELERLLEETRQRSRPPA